jgi:hypothetical protein
MRLALMIGVAVSALMLSSCASRSGNFIGDNLPVWAGGLPPDAPPRQGAPGYRAYLRSISGEEAASTTAAPATKGPVATAPATTASVAAAPAAAQKPPNDPPRKAPDPIDQPIH